MQSLSRKEIAAALFVGERTVETHMASIYRKLNVRSRTDLITRFAGVLQPDES
jgi:DNA-binding CsgD family transcriptional regulator